MTFKLNVISFLLLPFISGIIISCSPLPPGHEQDGLQLLGPDGSISMEFGFTHEQGPVYTVWYHDSLLLESSRLGLVLEDSDFSAGLRLEEASAVETVRETYEMLQGKRLERIYEARQKTFVLSNADGDHLEIIFRVSNDGVAFRYHIPDSSIERKKIVRN